MKSWLSNGRSVPPRTLRSLAAGAAVLIVVALTGCSSYAFTAPPDQGSVVLPSKTTVTVTWNSSQQCLRILVDNVDKTSLFGPGSTSSSVTADLALPPGDHALTATGSIYCWYCIPNWTTNTQTRRVTVKRQPGSFVEISGDTVHRVDAPRTVGSVRLTICSACGTFGDRVATFTDTVTNAVIGSPIPFRRDTRQSGYFTYTPGGAGFSDGNVGIVLDAGFGGGGSSNPQMAFRFLSLDTGLPLQASPLTVYEVGGPSATPLVYNPRLFQSPDKTIIAVVTVSQNQQNRQIVATFIDAVGEGKVLGTIPNIPESATTLSVEVNASSDTIELAHGGNSFSIPIP
jgi:hypothetical protein